MRFAFTDDQKMLRDTVREVLQRECAPEVVRAAWEGRTEGIRGVWDTLAETGVIGMTASEAVGPRFDSWSGHHFSKTRLPSPFGTGTSLTPKSL